MDVGLRICLILENDDRQEYGRDIARLLHEVQLNCHHIPRYSIINCSFPSHSCHTMRHLDRRNEDKSDERILTKPPNATCGFTS